MPYVNIRITREGGTTPSQKAALMLGVTELLASVLGKSPDTTVVVVDEVELENWGIGGVPVEEYRQVPPRAGCHRVGIVRPATGKMD
jgi:4-oxalocrotonate tautomerase